MPTLEPALSSEGSGIRAPGPKSLDEMPKKAPDGRRNSRKAVEFGVRKSKNVT
jgi:hypothetical protein